MCQACLLIINYINELQLEGPNQPPPDCGNHAQERSHRVPGEEEIAVHSGGTGNTRCANN